MKTIIVASPEGFLGEVKGLLFGSDAVKQDQPVLYGLLDNGARIVLGRFDTAESAQRLFESMKPMILSPTLPVVYVDLTPPVAKVLSQMGPDEKYAGGQDG
jgi:hypothetical protein